MKRIAILKAGAKMKGGLEKHALRIARAFAARGDAVTWLSDQPLDLPSPLALQTIPSAHRYLPSFLRLKAFDRESGQWLRQNSFDLVFGMDRTTEQTHLRLGNGVHAAYLRQRAQVEGRWKAFTCRINPLHREILRLERKALENPALQKVFVNSHMVRREVLEHYRVSPETIAVIHNGVEWQEMERPFRSWPEKRLALCQRYSLDPELFHLLFIGNGYLRKGLLPLLEGLAKLSSRRFFLSVIGKEKQRAFFEKKAHALGLRERVRFFGPTQDILPFYQLADALAIPSFYDPFANVTVEALAMGLSVLSSKSNGGSEILTSQTGVLIDDLFSPTATAEALEEILRRPKTPARAEAIRQSVGSLDFSHQLERLLGDCG